MIITASLSVKRGQNKKGEAISDFPLLVEFLSFA